MDSDTAEQREAARVVDANANRAREALRVVEDYARFVLDDPCLTERTKTLRHALAAVLAPLPDGLLVRSRDTAGDVGTTLTAPAERQRRSVGHVLAANMKRLQESLRAIEEYGKVLDPELGAGAKRLRYGAYELERWLVARGRSGDRWRGRCLQVLVTEGACVLGLERTVREALAGGADVIQLREKQLNDRDLLDRAEKMRTWTGDADALLVVNDRADVARACGADAVHLGQQDLPVAAARRVVGPWVCVGVSTHSVTQVRQAVQDGADCLGVGPVFASRTKSFTDLPGLDLVRQVGDETSLPWFAIGGIGPATIDRVIEAGARRVAVSAAVIGSDDPREAARVLRARLDQCACSTDDGAA